MNRKILSVLILLVWTLNLPVFSQVRALRCENLTNPLSIDNATPHFSWMSRSSVSNDCQSAYEMEIATTREALQKGKADVWRSGKVSSQASVMVPYEGPALQPRQQYYWRVRTWNAQGKCLGWSEVAEFGIGIIGDDMQGDFITTANPENTTPVLSTTVDIRKPRNRHILHVNSLGYHELYVNGRKVGEDVLAPAVSQLNLHSLIVSYDITTYLHKGSNTIALWLGRGWYKQHNFDNSLATPVVRAELDEVAGSNISIIATTDCAWRCNSKGIGFLTDIGTWMPLQFGGERMDARQQLSLDRVGDAPVKVVSISQRATPQMFPGNECIARLKAKAVTQLPDGRWMVDFGRNITGWFEMDFHDLTDGTEVTMEYADDYTTQPELSGEKDVFVYSSAKDACHTFSNHFNHHAFRYVVISGMASAPAMGDMTALQLSARQAETTTFACSDPDINAIHDMMQRTLRCLTFSGYMVDCPHLERMGYGGDGNSSTMTLQTMQDAAGTYYNWLDAWADAQDEDGGMPHVAPAGGGGGGPYWCGFIIQASWRAFLNYGDDRMIRKHYASMKRWVDYCKRYSPDGLLERWPDTKNRMWFLGDWLTPAGVDAGNERSVSIVSNCFVAECLSSLSRIADYLGYKSEAARYREECEALKAKILSAFYNADDYTFATASPLDMSYAMNTGVVPADIYNKVADRLVELSRTKYNTHIAVGLVGVPVFTEWATRNHQVQLMYDILKQPDYPGYLDMIGHGATTTWESWDRSRSRIHNCYNGIGTWFYQALAGITPDPEQPGYRHFSIDPQLPKGIDWVKATKQTPYGEIAVDVKIHNGTMSISATIPFGTTATIGGKEYGSGTWKINLGSASI